MFLYTDKELTARKKRTHDKTIWVRMSRAVCGQQMLLTPKHVYCLLWSMLFVLTLQDNDTGVFNHPWIPRDSANDVLVQ